MQKMDMIIDKKQLLSEYEACLFDFWGEEPTKSSIIDAWHDYLDAVKEDGYEIPAEYYNLTRAEKQHLYKLAEV